MGPAEVAAMIARAHQLLAHTAFDEAEPLLRTALEHEPGNPAAREGVGLLALGRDQYEAACAEFEALLAEQPGRIDTRARLAEALYHAGSPEAEATADRVLEANPMHPLALFIKGRILADRGDHMGAVKLFERACSYSSPFERFIEDWRFRKLDLSDWSAFELLNEFVLRGVRSGRAACEPLVLMAISDTPADILRCARTYTARNHPPKKTPPSTGPRAARDGPIRVGFISGDFHDHPVAHLFVGPLAHLDRDRIEPIAFSHGVRSEHPVRARLESHFAAFHHLLDASDEEIARLIHAEGIDITVSMNGYTLGARPDIMAWRPAPVQVSYLGYPGTMGAPYIDYLIADREVAPDPDHFSEKLAWMPDSFLPTDDLAPHPAAPRREAHGLPDKGVVFMGFNRPQKITPHLFDAWMRILAQVDGSVLWLNSDTLPAQDNLRREAKARGVDPSRLVIAGYEPDKARHLGRTVLADLFLDTTPYNAHATASDALWAGVPLVTCRGRTFSGRVAASLLKAAGLAELITDSLDDYVALAVALGNDRGRLAALRRRVETEVPGSPLFDSARYARNLESALETMHRRSRQGLAPESFAVEPRFHT